MGGVNADTSKIALALSESATTTAGTNFVNSGSFTNDYDVENRGSVVRIKRTDGAAFAIETSDGLADSGLSLAYKEASSISDLPAKNYKGFQVKVIGDAELSRDDYYVEFVTNDGSTFGEGSYQEISGFSISQGIDNTTFPHQLININENVFSFAPVSLSTRQAGDDNSNPMPSFVGNKINNLFVHSNRLGVLSNDNVSMSESGELFNFFRVTNTSFLDSAPIDVTVASKNVANILSAVGFQENLVLFSEGGQFVLKGGDALTPKTVSITPVTNFDVEADVDPLPVGSYIYFPFSRGSFTGLREFSTSATTDTYDSVEVSDHVPRYVPSNLIGMAGTTSEDIIALLSGDEPNALYVYNYFWNGNQKLLSAWSKFTFKGDIRGLQFIDSTLYLITVHNGETNLEALPLESGLKDPVGYNTYLDQRIEATVLNGNDTITLPYTPASSDEIQVYTKDGLKLSSSRIGSTVTLTQAVSEDTDVWVGYPYEMRYTFSELLFKAAAGNSKSPSNAAKLKVRNGSLFYNDSAYFKVSVTPLYRDTYENVFTPDVVGSTTLGELNLDSGAYRFPVFSNAEDTTITITNDSALPSNITSAEFESFVHSRSSRYAG